MAPSCFASSTSLSGHIRNCNNHVTIPRNRVSQKCRAQMVYFSEASADETRTPWHTLPIKHVVESQQFDKVH